jgi:hypothetical protein
VPGSVSEGVARGLLVWPGGAAVPRRGGEDDARDLMVWLEGEAMPHCGSRGDARGLYDCGRSLVNYALRFYDLDGFGLR